MIQVKVHPEGALAGIAAAAGQLDYAVSVGINRVANIGQTAEREHMRTAFRLRQGQFVLRGVKIDKADRATKTSWRARIQLAYPDERRFMDEHEQGGDRVRYGGARLWQPNKEVFKTKIIGRANPLHPKNLHLHENERGRIVGDQRTFIVKATNGQVLVLQRTERLLTKASGRNLKGLTLDNVAVGMGLHRRKEKALHRTAGTRLLYRLVERVRIPADLEFVPTISKAAEAAWPAVANQALVEALRGSK